MNLEIEGGAGRRREAPARLFEAGGSVPDPSSVRPRRRRLAVAVALAVVVASVGPAVASEDEDGGPEIAVLRLYNRAANPWWDTVGAERAQGALNTLLADNQPLVVMPHQELADALAERRLWLTGELSPAGATKLGRQLRLRFLVAGTLVEYGTGATASNERRGRKLLGLGGPKDFKAELVLRLIDGATGATIWSDSRRDQVPLREVVQQTEGADGSAEAAIFERLVMPMLEGMGSQLAQAVAELAVETEAPTEESAPAAKSDG